MDKKAIVKGIVIVTVLIFFLGCSSEKPSPETPSSAKAQKTTTDRRSIKGVTVTITPPSPTKGTILVAKTEGISKRVIYRWFVNETALNPTPSNTLRTDELEKGDKVRVEVLLNGNVIAVARPVTISNSPPRITMAYLLPVNPTKDSTITAVCEAEDPDEDEVEIKYYWYKNGQFLAEETEQNLNGPFNKGDLIEVECQATDGETESAAVRRSLTIKNSPPEIEENLRDIQVTNSVLKAKVIARDPDGDLLRYSLEEAPEGMTISDKGEITWNIPDDFIKGQVNGIVVVSDPEGLATKLRFTINIKRRTSPSPTAS